MICQPYQVPGTVAGEASSVDVEAPAVGALPVAGGVPVCRGASSWSGGEIAGEAAAGGTSSGVAIALGAREGTSTSAMVQTRRAARCIGANLHPAK
jgi:hypothetical protein